ncbi:uncharacterized protein RSE6_02935 [Rhynchosporium secalis]|uniref:Uncharacterized protein n=1 Tax=Rhynchosporium secalis TaxID=38038 RepID=A0A1E1M314_RHYSE|nr:uncharacterized protein RSE6_02935 [Rhynchosporium secalis]
MTACNSLRDFKPRYGSEVAFIEWSHVLDRDLAEPDPLIQLLSYHKITVHITVVVAKGLKGGCGLD